MAQFLRPDSNVTQTSFNGGFAEIDESSASDADYAWSVNGTAAVLEVGLSDPGSTPSSGTTTVRYRIAKTSSGTVTTSGASVDVTCAVYQGSTLIASDTTRTATGTWTEYSFTPDMSAVTDWNDLRLRFTTTAVPGKGIGISWAEIEAPDGGRTGGVDAQLSDLVISAEGELPIAGDATPTLDAVTLSADGVLTSSSDINGSLAATLDAVTLSADAALALTADATPTLDDITIAAEGALALQAALAKTLGAITLSATGDQEDPLPSTADDLLQIKSIRWAYHTPHSSHVSGWTGSATTFVEPWRAKWHASVELAAIQGEANIRAIRGFLAKRKGQLIPFRLYATPVAQNANSGVTVSSTASAGATSMSISGAATSLNEGEFVTVNGQLLCLTADQSGSSISFRPPLREQANAGITVVTSRPYALVHMANARLGWSTMPGRLFGVSFDAAEVILEADPEAVPEAA